MKDNATKKEQIKARKQEKKKIEEELDDLAGTTVRGKAICGLAFLGMMAVFMAIFTGIVKLNVGSFASDVLAPVIADVPIARSILPAELQKKTPKEIQAEEAAAEQAFVAEQSAEAAAAEQAASETAAAQALQAEQAASEAAADSEAASAAALADYVDTYSTMKPKKAAKVLDNMMTAQSDLVVKILSNMTPESRAAILSNMSVTNASAVTVLMEQ